jgi:hypothetical protein
LTEGKGGKVSASTNPFDDVKSAKSTTVGDSKGGNNPFGDGKGGSISVGAGKGGNASTSTNPFDDGKGGKPSISTNPFDIGTSNDAKVNIDKSLFGRLDRQARKAYPRFFQTPVPKSCHE